MKPDILLPIIAAWGVLLVVAVGVWVVRTDRTTEKLWERDRPKVRDVGKCSVLFTFTDGSTSTISFIGYWYEATAMLPRAIISAREQAEQYIRHVYKQGFVDSVSKGFVPVHRIEKAEIVNLEPYFTEDKRR